GGGGEQGGAVSALLLLALPVAMALGQAPPATAPGPLALTPANTVILAGSEPAGKALQYYLLNYHVGEQVAAGYTPEAKVDRAASPGFPLLVEGTAAALPPGKNILAVGATHFLTAEERQRLEESPGAVLLRRTGNVVVIAGSPLAATAGGSFTA